MRLGVLKKDWNFFNFDNTQITITIPKGTTVEIEFTPGVRPFRLHCQNYYTFYLYDLKEAIE